MRSLDVVVAHADLTSAEDLALSLGNHFRSVSIATTADDLRSTIARRRLKLAVVDLDLIATSDVRRLRAEFDVCVVCVHRIPDERMWADALEHGAVDCCQTSDISGIIDAVRRNVQSHSHAA